MKTSLRKLGLLFAFVACGSIAMAQLPNEKFGKPSNLEWDYKGWGDAIDADAIDGFLVAVKVAAERIGAGTDGDVVVLFCIVVC